MTRPLDVDLTEQVRLATAARKIVRAVSSEHTLARVVEVSQAAILEGFRATGVWVQAFRGEDIGHGTVRSGDGRLFDLPLEIRQMGRRTARRLWALQRVGVVDAGMTDRGIVSPAEATLVLEWMADFEEGSQLLCVPLGAGQECLGALVLTRPVAVGDWTSGEQRAALDIGRDLGRALATARSFEKERRVAEELRELSGYKTRLISTLAHELKNPLTAILGHVEMVQGLRDLEPAVRHSVRAIERGGQRMQRLVDDLLDLSRSGRTAESLVPTAVDLSALVEEVVESMDLEVLRKRLALEREVPPTPVVAWGDRPELGLAVTHVISNAVRYTRPGGRVLVRLTEGEEAVRLEVTDTGLGISEEDQSQLFQDFFRSTNPEALASSGSGLGLAIVRQVVDRHHGGIEVRSRLGEGTTIVLTLPSTKE